MKKLTKEQFEEYMKNPLQMDEKVRKWCDLPEDRYYSVSVWPEDLSGMVHVTNLFRVVKSKKISKSNQS